MQINHAIKGKRAQPYFLMTFIVTDSCIRCKYTDCVDVCPVDCFHEGENMLVINPETCIDCGVCEPECPAEAIKADTLPNMEKWVEINQKYANLWPTITRKKPHAADADDWLHVKNKFETYFSEKSG